VWAVCHGIIATQAMVHDTAMPDAGKAIGSRPRDQG
jgi:hypothetical protein